MQFHEQSVRFEDVGEDDDLGLLADVRPLANTGSSEGHRVRQRFEDICSFVDRTGRRLGEATTAPRGGSTRLGHAIT